MSWLLITLTSYFLSALTIILDKFILTGKKVASPPVYSFYIAILGMLVLVLAPFGLVIPSIQQIIASLIAGALFTFGILALYFAICIGQASRVAAFVGALVPLFTFIIAVIFFNEELNWSEMLGVLLLISGGMLVIFDLPFKTDKKKFWKKFSYALLAGGLLAAAYSIFKFIYTEQSFIGGFIWTRLGSGLAVVGFFLVPPWRRDILESLKGFKKPTRSRYRAGGLVILNKIIGGTASILFNYAIALGSVTIVNSLVAFQYLSVLVLAVIFSRWHPEIFSERLFFWDWAQKIGAIVIIGIGIYLVAKPTLFMSF